MDQQIIGQGIIARRIIARRILPFFMMATLSTAVTAGAQQASDAYSGVSQPPQDQIQTSQEPAPVIAKPSAGVLAAPAATQAAPATNPATPAAQDNYQPAAPQQEALSTRPGATMIRCAAAIAAVASIDAINKAPMHRRRPKHCLID